MFCPHNDNCESWSKAIGGNRACYYGDPVCWKGWVDNIIFVLRRMFWRKIE